MQARNFVWHELVTTDLDAAETFYGKVAGWRLADAGMPGFRYTIAHAGEAPIGGLMRLPDEVCAQGGKPGWSGYIGVPDTDAAAAAVVEAGGRVHRAPDDIPGVGRFAVVADPQGAPFVLFTPNGEGMPAPAPGTPGVFGWNELHASDGEAAFGFYSRLFGWTKSTAVDMGPMGTYQVFAGAGRDIGGLFTDGEALHPFWLYYIAVEDIDRGLARVTEAGGTVTAGPHPVPGDMWIVHASDPQGVRFALVGARAKA